MGYIIVIVSILFILFFGIYGTKKVDRFIEINQSSTVQRNEEKVLIMGNKQVTKSIESYLDTNNIQYDIIYDNNMQRLNNSYKCLIILFNDDLDNLMACALSRKWYNIESVISVYNDFENERIFDEYGVMRISINNIYNKQCLSAIKEKIKNA